MPAFFCRTARDGAISSLPIVACGPIKHIASMQRD